MGRKTAWSLVVLLCLDLAVRGEGGTDVPKALGTEAENEIAGRWSQALGMPEPSEEAAAATRIAPLQPGPPFSFVYGGEKSADLLPRWKRTAGSSATSSSVVKYRVTYSDPNTGLEVRAEMAAFRDFPAVEWVLYLKNTGAVDTPILEDVLPLDVRLPASAESGEDPILHHARGAVCSIDDFAPVTTRLGPNARVHLEPGGGRSSSEVMPFFNLDAGAEGMVIALGWTGQWAATFARDQENQLHVSAGMALTHLKLRPGEEIRTPRILAIFWQGDRMRGNNLLRRFLLAHHRPAPGNKPLILPALVGSWGGSAAADHLKTVQRIIEHQWPIELYWIDAEWFGHAPWFKSNGNWDVRRDLYPQGFRAISDPLHQSGRKFLLWFEPQRVCAGTDWAKFKERPGWLLELGEGTPEYKQRDMNWGIPHEDPRWVVWESRRSQITDGDLLWNMGEPAARQFLTDWLSRRIDEFGLDWYREDFNIAPLEYWRNADAADRQGITEIRYVEGLYAMWDELLQRHPHLAIDNCASGGRRIDLETVPRSTALWRTDWPVDALHKQCHTFGILAWVPLNMSGPAVLKTGNEYEIRSAMTAGINVELPPPLDPESTRQAKALLEQYLGIRKFYYGDYYPLTPYSQANDVWMAYQLDLPETGEGLLVVLKRPMSAQASETLRLQALDRSADYQVTSLDSGTTEVIPAARLLDQGLVVRLAGNPDSALVRYSRVK
ncbi:MAG: hypothetical protein A2V98_14585 [Planctomycetes bacterium RBG_16_64_12]|nr:MAG: hypothetical protein A2V98_14585 [Planctomycetes bacterium RBG_16_64_12]